MHLRTLLAGTLLVGAVPVPIAAAGDGVEPGRAVQSASIRGTLVDAATARPIPGALVVLTDAGGERRGASLADAGGRFILAVAKPGRYTLRAERVGYATAVSEPIDVAAGQTVAYRMAARVQGLSLEGITVHARARCEIRPAEGTRTQRIWEEVRKALSGAAWTEAEGWFEFSARRWTRDLEPTTLGVQGENSRIETYIGRTPFHSAPAAELRDLGWVRRDGSDQVFFAPDAATVLSDEFLDGHCFRVVTHPSDATRLGLTFEPVRNRRLPDVQGTLWVDRQSAELQELEYRYTGLSGEASDLIGGRVHFERVPGGAWVVRRWTILMPQMRDTRYMLGGRRFGGERVALFREEGGEILEIRARGGSVVRHAPAGAVEGMVFDSTLSAPIPGARVFLSGTSHAAVADSQGRFRLEGVPSGVYFLSFSHPRLDTLSYYPPPTEVRLGESGTARVEVAVPPRVRIRTAACRDSTAAGGVLFGTVRNLANDLPLATALVSVSWRDPGAAGGQQRVTRVADGSGAYIFCSLPTGVRLQVGGEFMSHRLPRTFVTLDPGAGREHGILIEVLGRVEVVGRTIPTREMQPVRVSGTIVQENGAPVAAGTVVRLMPAEGVAGNTTRMRETRTDARGAFSLGKVPPGEYRVEITETGRGTTVQPLAVGAGRELMVEIQLGGKPKDPGPMGP